MEANAADSSVTHLHSGRTLSDPKKGNRKWITSITEDSDINQKKTMDLTIMSGGKSHPKKGFRTKLPD